MRVLLLLLLLVGGCTVNRNYPCPCEEQAQNNEPTATSSVSSSVKNAPIPTKSAPPVAVETPNKEPERKTKE
ncbi:MAG: hypothetical protein WCT18_01385 [Patescibacteria group bacterium]